MAKRPELRSEIAKWREMMPRRAEKFHEQLSDIEQELSKAVSFLFRKSRLDSIAQRLDRLTETADQILTLDARAVEQEKKLEPLTAHRSLRRDRRLKDWVGHRCAQWLKQLGSIGATSYRNSELPEDERCLEEVAEEMERVGENLNLVGQAYDLISDPRVDASELDRTMPDFIAELVEVGYSLEWERRLNRMIDPLRSLADAKPPKDLERINDLIVELRGWCVVFQGEEDIRNIEDLFEQVYDNWRNFDPENISDLRRQCEARVKELMEKAADMRSDRFRGMRVQLEGLNSLLGLESPDIREEMRQLQAETPGRPETHSDWLQRLEGIEDHLREYAASQDRPLRLALAASVDEVRNELHKLKPRLLADADIEKCAEYNDKLSRLPTDAIADILCAILTVGSARDRLDELKERSDKDVAQLQALLEQQDSRFNDLLRWASLVEHNVDDLRGDVAAIKAGLDGTGLRSLHERALTLRRQLETEEQTLIANCINDIEREQIEIDKLRRLLFLAGENDVSSVIHALANDASLEQVVNKRHEVGEALAATQREAGQVAESVERSLADALEDLTELKTRPMLAEDLKLVIELMARIEQGLVAEYVDNTSRLATQLEDKREHEALARRLMPDRLKLRGRVYMLHRDFKRLRERALDGFAPESYSRLRDLIGGLTPGPKPREAAEVQIEESERLLEKVELHALRQAATEVDAAIEILQKRPPAQTDLHTMQLLHDIEQCDRHEELPVELRNRLLMRVSQEH